MVNQVQLAMAKGRIVEELYADHCRRSGLSVEDVRGLRTFQRRDVDFIVNDVTVDVKRDDYPERNIYLEDRFSDGRLGCLWVTRAEEWAYVFTQTGTVYVLNMPRVQHYVSENRHKLREVVTRKYQGRAECRGLLLPVPTEAGTLLKRKFTLEALTMDASALF